MALRPHIAAGLPFSTGFRAHRVVLQAIGRATARDGLFHTRTTPHHVRNRPPPVRIRPKTGGMGERTTKSTGRQASCLPRRCGLLQSGCRLSPLPNWERGTRSGGEGNSNPHRIPCFMGRRSEITRPLRRNQTPEERELWEFLRGERLNGLRFRRQHPIGPFVVDFYCRAARLVVELEGAVHLPTDQQDADHERREYLRARGLRVLRSMNQSVKGRPLWVRAMIRHAALQAMPGLPSPGLRPPSP